MSFLWQVLWPIIALIGSILLILIWALVKEDYMWQGFDNQEEDDYK